MADYDADMIIRDVGHRTRELRNVDYILLAEFDIDQGSMLKYEVPYSTGIDSQKLAELMLPDGAHLRDEDWTVFFLNKDLEEEFQAIEHEREAARARTRVADAPKKQGPIQMQAFVYAFVQNGGEVGWEQVDNDKKMLVLNKDNVTIVTRGREELIRLDGADDLQFTQLEPMFTCAFTDASAVGLRFSSGAEEDLFQAHCEKIITDLEEGADDDVDTEPDTVGDDGDEDGEPETTKEEQEALIEHYISLRPDFLYGLNLVRTKKNKDWVRGAKVKAMAVCTRFQFVHVFKPLLILALENFFAADPEEGLQIVQELFESINAMDLSEMPDLSEPQKLIQRNALDQGSNFFTTHCLYREVKIPVRVPLAMLDDEVGDVSVISLVNKFGPDVMTIYNSLLCERRIIFLGYNRPANEVCNYVLAAIQMICPPMRGLVRRAFPYINLHNMSFLGVNGFIAGATNLIFQEREMWWDILCDLETGRVTLNPTLAARLKENPETSAAADAVLFGEVMYTIESHFGEDRVRNLFQNYTQHLIDLVLGEAEWPDDKARSQDMDANAERMALVKATDTFAGYDTNLKQLRQQSAIKNFEVVRHIRKLSIRQDLTDQEMMAIYTDFTNSVESQEQLEELLTFLPAQDGGLFPVAMGLFHPNVELRRLTVELLKRIEMLPAGQALFESLNEMVLLAFERNRHLVKDRRAK